MNKQASCLFRTISKILRKCIALYEYSRTLAWAPSQPLSLVLCLLLCLCGSDLSSLDLDVDA